MASKSKSQPIPHITKKCPECLSYIPLNAEVCDMCNHKVGEVLHYGMAKKRIDWKSYIICFLSWLAFGLYIWWAFFRE